jgi:hypothetical protein
MGRLFLIYIISLSVNYFFEVPVRGSDLRLAGPYSLISDTISDEQLLFNGRVWRSLNSNVVGDEFLFSKDWLTGDVNINEITFHDVLLRYDIYNDQLLANYKRTTFVQLNKELIREFTLVHEYKKDTFKNFSGGNDNPVNGFGQVLYGGKSYLIIKHEKRIQQLAVDDKYDQFYQLQTIYILKGGRFYKLNGKKDLIDILSDKKQQVQTYIRENKIRVRKKVPESYIPVLKYYDTL